MAAIARDPLVVLQIIPSLESGGAERGCLDVAAALHRSGNVALVASRGGRLEGELRALGGLLLRLNAATKNPFCIVANVVRLMRLIRRYRVSIVHARSRAPAWSALIAARLTGTPFVTTFHGAYRATSALKRLANSVMARADRVIAISAHIARHIVETYGTAPDRLVTIPRGIDLRRFDPAAVPTERIAAQKDSWAVPEGARIILMPGRLTSWKGHLLAIDALAALVAHGRKNVVLVFAGDHQGHESYEAQLRARMIASGVADLIRLPGHCADIPAAMLAADLVMSLAHGKAEAFGRVPVEAQAMGRPPIATALGGALETVLDGVTGWLVPEGDAEALARAIAHALDADDAARSAMIEAGRTHVTARFSLHAMTAATLDVYRDLAE